MSFLKKKRKTTEKKLSPSPQSTPNPSLPDDLLLSYFARVSRLYYPTLSLVSKRFQSLLSSVELYKARSHLGNTDICLYVCLEFYPCSQCPTVPPSRPTYVPGLVAVGSNIYSIEKLSSYVSILDCKSHTWSEAPSLPVKLVSLSASVLDGKIYVAGCSYKDDDSPDSFENTLEVFDTKAQTWDLKTIPCKKRERNIFYFRESNIVYSRSACIDGKFYLKTSTEAVSYSSKEDRWDLVGEDMCDSMISHYYCEIENVVYSASDGILRWYDSEADKWELLKCLEGLPKFPRGSRIRLADYGGKLVVLWEGDVFDLRHIGGYKKIWCAEIELERWKRREIWGKVVWFDIVLTIPKSCYLAKVLAVTV
ncbi:unnamed protein product [Microthlaspi erraticum]|uniref:F-box domain-containing protein n=1 Tax=Microthlaspi erraticum TaxID=1685480 RepID=A0A6D2ILZ8_9BRAS|nr:unnamed protein product [Microthlaspi erraticum]